MSEHATASRAAEASERKHALNLFFAIRSAPAVLAAAALLGAVTAWFGLVETPMPSALAQEKVTLPLYRLLVLGVAVLPVVALHSPLADLEVVATSRFRARQRLFLASLSASSAAIFLGTSALVISAPVVEIMARSWLAWFGLALISGSLLGWRLSWMLPSFVAVALWYWGTASSGQYQWWEFSARPSDDLPSHIISVVLLAAGLVMYAATPWRRRLLRRGPHK
ncbi:hypothetical protein [Salinispora arenicola]|uniref:hypothetical protein n=1 Tax=Salinispora arenicola TaxID=168697 RepID=UPI0016AE6BB7|nr:hypothetical protein [Salinispora arenicola]NIL59532.1 hypothetical protein [Salinispora arenicola]NIL63019.1 hypothetical protein [Salinispora arenicola]